MSENKNAKRIGKFLWVIPVLLIIGTIVAVFATKNSKTLKLGDTEESEKQAATTSSDGLWEYNIINTNEAEIVSYKGTDTDLTIPNSIDGYTVTTIGDNAFYYSYTIVSIGDMLNVTSIGERAFNGSSITSIGDMPKLTSMGKSAFNGSSITSIGDMPNLTTIGDSAFYGCTNLASIDISNAQNIGSYIVSDNTIIICNPDSVAADYAKGYYTSYTYKDKTITGIKVTIDPYKMSYLEEKENLDVTGGFLTVIYAEKDEEGTNLTSTVRMTSAGVETSGFDNTVVGTNTVTVKFREKTETFDVEIIEKPAKEVIVTELPLKKTYKQNEKDIDLTGGQIRVKYDDNTEKIKDMEDSNVTVTGFDTTIGTKTITISYNGVVAIPTFEIEVIQKIDYEENQDGSGGITITGPTKPAEGEEGNPDVVIPGEIDGKPVTEIGDKAFAKPVEIDIIEIPDSVTKIADNAFEGNEDAIIICNPGSAAEEYAKDHDMSYIYKDKTITRIKVTTPPAKVEYLEGKESLNVAGGRLTVTYVEIDEETGTNLTSTVRMTSAGVATSGFDNTIVGTNTVTVTFSNKETTFDVIITANTYTITFEPGENATVDTPTKEVTNGQKYGTLPNATKEGHTFKGWYDESGNKIEENTTVNLTSDIILHARYEINKYTVTFKNDDGTTIKITTVNYGSTVEFDGQTPTKNNIPAGYEATFNGWTGSENLQNITSNTTVTATYKLTPIVYTITYENTKDSNISDTTKFPTSYTVEDLNIRLENLVNQEKLIFDGWYTTNDENGEKITIIDISKLGNITLYARWKQVQEEIWLSSDVYKIGDKDIDNYEDGDIYIEKIMPETTVAEFIENCESNGDITVINKKGEILEDNDLVGTNMTIKVTKDNKEITLTAVVMGDLDGNGKVTVTDLSGINQTVLRTIKLEGAIFKAADLDDNNKITVTDLSGINQKILKVIEFKYDKKEF